MSYEAYLAETFQKSIKLLKKKYPTVKEDLSPTIQALEKDPTLGDPVPGWNREIWKIRVTSSDVKKGKRGGYRLIYFWKAEETKIYHLFAYFKGEQAGITKKEIDILLKKLNEELGKDD